MPLPQKAAEPVVVAGRDERSQVTNKDKLVNWSGLSLRELRPQKSLVLWVGMSLSH